MKKMALVVMLSVACGSDSDPLATHTGAVSHSSGGPGPSSEPPGTSGEPTGTTGGTTEGPTTGADTTGGLEPTRELCERYLACLAVTQPEALPAAQTGFGANGTCWDGPPDQIEQCITACYTALGDSHEAFPDEPKCMQCTDDADCVAGERCVLGGCYTSYCGDGLVDDDEICDDPSDPNCDNCYSYDQECNPFSNAGCEPGEFCIPGVFTTCSPEPASGPGDGHVCDLDGGFLCGEGLYCTPLMECPGEACCTLVCNVQEPDTCPKGRVCQSVGLSNYIGACLPPG